MLARTIRDWFEAALGGLEGGDGGAPDFGLAAAVLLVEVMRADAASTDAERRQVVAALQAQFALPPDAVEALLARAERASAVATDLFTYTSRVNEAFDPARKVALLEQMWRVAYADGRLDGEEHGVLRKVADLLYIHPGDYANAKMRARAAVAPGAG